MIKLNIVSKICIYFFIFTFIICCLCDIEIYEHVRYIKNLIYAFLASIGIYLFMLLMFKK